MSCGAKGYSPTNASAREYSWMSSMEERLETLEAEARLFRASVRGGAIVAYTDDLDQVARLGEGAYSVAGGGFREAPVLAVSTPDNFFHLLIDTELGFVSPAFRYNFVEDTFRAVTNASFENCWKSNFNLLGHAVVLSHLVTADSGTNGEFRLQIDGLVASDVVSISGGEQIFFTWNWDLTNQISLGSGNNLRIQARRTSGTGDINVYAPDGMYVRATSLVSTATPGGIPST